MIENIVDQKKCFGCRACENICPVNAITFKAAEDAFCYPYVDKDKCLECGLCEKTCIANKGVSFHNTNGNYAAVIKDEKAHYNSSSGGLFTVLSDWILKEKKGHVYGCIYFDKNAIIVGSSDLSLRDKMRGSKYLQSDMQNCYKDIVHQLQNGEYVMFSGTPCQCAAIIKYMETRHINTDKLYTMDFICHGSTSPVVFRNYCEWLEKTFRSPIKEYYFRSRILSGENQCAYAIFENGNKYLMPPSYDPYFYIFLKDLYHRETCYQCPFAQLKRVSDVTVGDMRAKGYRGKGYSQVIVNTTKGALWLETVSSNIEKESYDITGQLQPQLKHPTAKPKNMKVFRENISALNFSFDKLKTPNFKKQKMLTSIEKCACKLHMFGVLVWFLGKIKH